MMWKLKNSTWFKSRLTLNVWKTRMIIWASIRLK